MVECLAGESVCADDTLVRGGGAIELRLRSYLTQRTPPIEHVGSVRAVITRGNEVLLMRNRDGYHVLPGGKLEPGESAIAALRREIREETGWSECDAEQLGLIHLEHLTPKPPGHVGHYPECLWIIYRGRVGRYDERAKLQGDFEVESSFRTAAAVQPLLDEGFQRLFLSEALRSIDRGS